MSLLLRSHHSRFLALALAAVLATACDDAPPLSPEGQMIVTGRVLSVTADADGSSSSSASAASADGSLGGIEVAVEGSTATTLTDAEGGFELRVDAELDRLVIRFRRGSLDARIELEGLNPGATLHLEVRLSGDDGTVVRRDDDGDFEVHGQVAFVALEGEAPTRTLRVTLSQNGAEKLVDIDESGTRFESDGDVLSFEAFLAALERTDVTVRLEGDVALLEDGTVLAISIKVETDEHADAGDDGNDDGNDDGDDDNSGPGSGDDDGDDDNSGPGSGDDDGDQGATIEFKGFATLIGISGVAPTRSIRLRIDGDATWEAVFVEGETSFDLSGDIQTVGGLVLSIASAADVRVEGRGPRLADGAIAVLTARAEIDD